MKLFQKILLILGNLLIIAFLIAWVMNFFGPFPWQTEKQTLEESEEENKWDTFFDDWPPH